MAAGSAEKRRHWRLIGRGIGIRWAAGASDGRVIESYEP
ncbi:MAG: hypothetical protein WD736_08925 [Chloroflexota bacterium]